MKNYQVIYLVVKELKVNGLVASLTDYLVFLIDRTQLLEYYFLFCISESHKQKGIYPLTAQCQLLMTLTKKSFQKQNEKNVGINQNFLPPTNFSDL